MAVGGENVHTPVREARRETRGGRRLVPGGWRSSAPPAVSPWERGDRSKAALRATRETQEPPLYRGFCGGDGGI